MTTSAMGLATKPEVIESALQIYRLGATPERGMRAALRDFAARLSTIGVDRSALICDVCWHSLEGETSPIYRHGRCDADLRASGVATTDVNVDKLLNEIEDNMHMYLDQPATGDFMSLMRANRESIERALRATSGDPK